MLGGSLFVTLWVMLGSRANILESRYGFAQFPGCLSGVFPHDQHVFYSSRGLRDQDDAIRALHQENRWSLTLVDASKDHGKSLDRNCHNSNYLIAIADVQELERNLEVLRWLPEWNPRGRFVVTCRNTFANLSAMLSRCFETLWRYDVVNSVLLLLAEDTPGYDVYNWYPYDNDCGTRFDHVVRIGTCSNRSIGDWFPTKIPKQLNRCRVIVRTNGVEPFILNVTNGSTATTNTYFETKGIEGNLLGVIADKLNLTMVFYYSETEVNWGDVFANGTVTGNLRYLQKYTGDIAAGHYSRFVQKYTIFDDGVVFYQDFMKWCVTHSPVSTKLEGLVKVMDLGTAVVTLVLCSFTAATMWYFGKSDLDSYRWLGGCLLNTLAILLGLSVARQPVTHKVRVFMALFVAYSMCLVTAYQTFLISNLANNDYVEEIRSGSVILC